MAVWAQVVRGGRVTMSRAFTIQAVVPREYVDGGLEPGSWPLHVLAQGEEEEICRPCVDCGEPSSCFCSGCFAKDQSPEEKWTTNQKTPPCARRDAKWEDCRFCREEKSSRARKSEAQFSGFNGLSRGFFTRTGRAKKTQADGADAKAQGTSHPQEERGEEVRYRIMRQLDTGGMAKATATKVFRYQVD